MQVAGEVSYTPLLIWSGEPALVENMEGWGGRI